MQLLNIYIPLGRERLRGDSLYARAGGGTTVTGHGRVVCREECANSYHLLTQLIQRDALIGVHDEYATKESVCFYRNNWEERAQIIRFLEEVIKVPIAWVGNKPWITARQKVQKNDAKCPYIAVFWREPPTRILISMTL